MPLYLVLGGAFAVALATTALQALFVGFGWTAIADRAGLKGDQQDAKKEKDQATDTFVRTMAAKDQELAQLRSVSAQVAHEKRAMAAENLQLRGLPRESKAEFKN